MTTQFSKGLITAASYYAVALALVWLTYQIWGQTYIHGPGLHHLIGFLALVGGAIWIILGVIRLLLNKQSKRIIGSLLVNLIVVTAVVTYFIIDINRDTIAEPITNKANIITINQDTTANSSSIVTGLGDTILLKVGDSTIIDKTKEWAK